MYSILAIGEIIRPIRVEWQDEHFIVRQLAYDSRKITDASHSLFFALRNIRDGHHFIADAYQKGIRNFVVSHPDLEWQSYPGANFLWVDDVLAALQQLATYHRNQFTKPIIGITGSNGKTVVKEWLTQLLQSDKKVYQSPKSYNSQIGVALALWNLSNDYDCAIIEAGISLPNEMDMLESMIQPEIGIFTNIGLAHAVGFDSKEDKIREKAKLFKASRAVILLSKYNLESYFLSKTVLFSLGEKQEDEVRILKSGKAEDQQTTIQIGYRGEIVTFTLPFQDKASIENALICLATLLFLGYSLTAIAPKLAQLRPVEMRLQLKKGRKNCSIIDDTYSNDLASLQIALDFLHQQKQHTKKSLILSEMEGLEERLRLKLLDLLRNQPLDRMVLVGGRLHELHKALDCTTMWFSDTSTLMQHLPELDFNNESILIKGSRAFHLEDVSRQLAAKTHETVLEINLSAMQHNLQYYRALLPPHVKMMAMVKAFSYGSGSFEVANLLQFNKVDYLAVAFADEGVELRQHGIDLPIMVLSPDEQVFEHIVIYDLEPELYSFRILHAFTAFLQSKNCKRYPVHIKIDTGMHRLGFLPDEMSTLTTFLLATDTIRIQSVFSHLVASGDAQYDDFTAQQLALFSALATSLEQELGYSFMKHIANTSGIARWPSAFQDMVRLGIGLYGVDSAHMDLPLEPVNQLKTTITQIKKLKAGETVGYDRQGILHRDGKVATVKIGYADGYSRRFGNGVGKMLVNGHLAPTIGNICMDMCMLDVTDIPANEEDEVIVFPDLAEAAASIGTIPYELLVNISSRVKRVYFYE